MGATTRGGRDGIGLVVVSTVEKGRLAAGPSAGGCVDPLEHAVERAFPGINGPMPDSGASK